MDESVIAGPAREDERVFMITLNRPDARNAINGEMALGIAAALDELDQDPRRAVGVISGAGHGFSAGMDLKSFLEDGDLASVPGRGFAGIAEAPPRKPIIAAVEGFAVAGGLEVALSCDLIVAARNATIGLPEVKRSLVAAGGGLLRLAQRIPYHVAAEIALTGESVPVERLYHVGLINRISEPGGAVAMATDLATGIADNAPLALAGSKHILSHSSDWGLEDGWALQSKTVEEVSTSRDALEGSRAFAERRAPHWEGR